MNTSALVQDSFKITRHAVVRAAQRGVPLEVVRLVLTYGRPPQARGGATGYFFGDQELRQAAEDNVEPQLLDKCLGRIVIASAAGSALTGYVPVGGRPSFRPSRRAVSPSHHRPRRHRDAGSRLWRTA